jgi:hypothetical protein
MAWFLLYEGKWIVCMSVSETGLSVPLSNRRRVIMKSGYVKVAVLGFLTSVIFLGCASIVSHDSRTTYGSSRSAPGHDTLRQIHPGETTKGWILQTLGSPTSENRLDDGAEILRYEYSSETRNKVGCLFLIDIDHSTVTEENIYIEVRDGIVVRYWRD